MGSIPIGSANAAGFWRRLAAAGYDMLLIAAILFVTSLLLVMARDGRAIEPGDLWFRVVVGIQIAAFYIYFWSHGGQTLGMRAWDIRVETRSGEPPSPGRAALRLLCTLGSLLALGLGFLWIVFDPQRRAWHDRISMTRVVHPALRPRR